MTKLTSLVLSTMMILQPITVLGIDGANSSDVLLTTTPQIFSANVPTKLPVNMDVGGIITTAEDVVITNTSKGPIIVHDIAVESKDIGWSMAHYTDDFNKLKVNSKVIGLQFNGDNVTSSGTTELNPAHWSAINGLESMTLNYDAKLAAQSNMLTDVEPVAVVFTLKWHEAGKADIVDPDINAPLRVGENKVFAFNFTNVEAEDDSVIWSSSDEGIATVRDNAIVETTSLNGSKECEVTAVSIGTTTITGVLKDGTSASMDVVVEERGLEVGAKDSEGNYEYSYGQYSLNNSWKTVSEQNGWGVRVIDNTQIDYASPLTTIQGNPVTNMAYLFYKSPATTLNLIDWDTSNVTNMEKMFYESQATSLDVSSFDTSNVTNMSGMFYGSKAISLNGLSSFDTSKTIGMSQMFWGSQATNLDVSNFDTSNITNMNYMFAENKSTYLNVSSFDTSKVTNMAGMFDSSKATNLDISNFDTSNATTMFGMFDGSQATSLDISNFDTSNVTTMCNIFRNSKATSLDLRNFKTSNVTDMSGMFWGSSATSLDVSSFNTSKVTNMMFMFWSSKATSINGLRRFNTSNVINMHNMFYDSAATGLDLRSFNTSNVLSMYLMFGNTQMTTLDLSSFDTSKVDATGMGGVFQDSKIKTLNTRTLADANKFRYSSNFPKGVTVTTKY